jgi:alkanesulfonate monooxygenase SsuD/methylene tetrahydromethanopterin reductase-like flavin-dependent oxidoreductase (luciferase family)
MKFCLFHLMPYAPLDLTFDQKYPTSWMALPNSYYDPKQGHLLYNRYLDELELGDQLGFDVLCVNEHHQTAYGLMPMPGVLAGALSRRTKQARIAVLGRALPLVNNPLNVAEEYAILDNITGGRLVAGFVRGIGVEYHTTGSNPAKSHERFHEAHDLIIQAWTRTGPFAFDGKHYQFQYVNLWPRPYQQPHPPVWVSGSHVDSAEWVAERGYTFATFLNPYDLVETLVAAYKRRSAECGLPEPGADRFAYLALCYTGETEDDARRGGEELLWYLNRERHPYFFNPPGYTPYAALARQMAAGERRAYGDDYDTLAQKGILMAGTPDQMIEKITYLHQRCNTGHLLMMNQAGFMSAERTRRSLELFAREVYPAIRNLGE